MNEHKLDTICTAIVLSVAIISYTVYEIIKMLHQVAG